MKLTMSMHPHFFRESRIWNCPAEKQSIKDCSSKRKLTTWLYCHSDGENCDWNCPAESIKVSFYLLHSFFLLSSNSGWGKCLVRLNWCCNFDFKNTIQKNFIITPSYPRWMGSKSPPVDVVKLRIVLITSYLAMRNMFLEHPPPKKQIPKITYSNENLYVVFLLYITLINCNF